MSSRSRTMAARLGALALLALLAWPIVGATVTSPLPDVPDRVLDQTGTLSRAQVAAFERRFAEFEARRGAQVAVVIVRTTSTDTIEQYAAALFEKNAFGGRGTDDGVLLLVAKDDRNARIEVGYGLEGTIPDIHANRVLEQHLVPAFRAGDFHGGIARATDALMALIEAEAARNELASRPEAPRGDLAEAGSIPPASDAARIEPAASEPPPAAPIEPYVDDPGRRLRSGVKHALADKLRAFEQRTGRRIAVVLLPEAKRPLPEYAASMLERHPVGHEDYAVVVASGNDDRGDIVLGERFAAVLPAVERQRFVSQVLVAKLWSSSEYQALDATTDAMILAVEGPGSPVAAKIAAAAERAAVAAQAAAVEPSTPQRPWWVVLEAFFGTLVIFSAIAAMFGVILGSTLSPVPAPLRSVLVAGIVGTAGWHFTGAHVPVAASLWAAAVAGLVAYFAKPDWMAGGSGSGRSGGRSVSSGSRRSSSSRSRGGRSGGGGASKRW